MAHRIGMDLGGTKIEIVVLDPAGDIALRRRAPTPAGDYAATLHTIKMLVLEAESEIGSRASVGIAMPGALSLVTGLVKNSNSTCLNGRPFLQDVQALLEREVRVQNDANCFALSEAVDGAGRGAAVVFGVILGTGVGGGIVIEGKVLAGVNAIAGEWGHNPLPLAGSEGEPLPACYCGRQGCVEAYLSGPAMAADHERVAGERFDAVTIARRAASGDTACAATLDRHARRLALALASVVNILDPEVIVLGGGLSNLSHLYDRVPELWRPHVFSDEVRTRLVPPRHGDSSGVRGAAWLWGNA